MLCLCRESPIPCGNKRSDAALLQSAQQVVIFVKSLANTVPEQQQIDLSVTQQSLYLKTALLKGKNKYREIIAWTWSDLCSLFRIIRPAQVVSAAY